MAQQSAIQLYACRRANTKGRPWKRKFWGYRLSNSVDHPSHYTKHPSGIECIEITEHMGFCLGNAIKYIWRADLKQNAIEDLEKAAWYIEREIKLRKKGL